MEKSKKISQELIDLSTLVVRMVKSEFKGDVDKNLPTLTQVRILHKIKKGVRHVGKLAEVFGISQPATSIMVNAMVENGFIERVPHPTDRRQIELHLTAKAHIHIDTGYKRASTKIDKKLSTLSEAKKKAIAKQLHELTLLLNETDN